MSETRPTLKIVGTDGNAFSLLGRARTVARKNNMNWEPIQKEAMSGDYSHLLATLLEHFEVE